MARTDRAGYPPAVTLTSAPGRTDRWEALRRPQARAGLLVLLLFLGTLALAGFFRAHQDPPKAARIAAESFLGRLAAGNVTGAYDQLCNETRSRLEREDFVAGIGGRPAVHTWRIDKVDRAGDGAVSVTATLADPGGNPTAYAMRVVDDRGAWRVCGDPLPDK
jgi:hypothetical protein